MAFIEISKDEALAALRDAAWTREHEPVYERALSPEGVPLWLHPACGHSTAIPEDEHLDYRLKVTGCAVCPALAGGGWCPIYVDASPPPEKMIGRAGSITRADVDLGGAEDDVRNAVRVGWVDHLFDYDLAVEMPGGRVWSYEVKRPAEVTCG